MKITREWLERQGACRDGIDVFSAQRECEAETLLRRLAEDNPEWGNWLMTRVLGRWDRVLYACCAARLVLPAYEALYPGDTRPREAIELAERAAAGGRYDTTAETAALNAARSAAWSAAWSAASNAAWSAAWSAASNAAWSAASAARSAAWSAGSAESAESAARSAARSAAWSATLRRCMAYGFELLARKTLCGFSGCSCCGPLGERGPQDVSIVQIAQGVIELA